MENMYVPTYYLHFSKCITVTYRTDKYVIKIIIDFIIKRNSNSYIIVIA